MKEQKAIIFLILLAIGSAGSMFIMQPSLHTLMYAQHICWCALC